MSYHCERKETIITGIPCTIVRVRSRECTGQRAYPVFLLGTTEREGENREAFIAHLLECVEKRVPDAEFSLVIYCMQDWNRDFSPWKAEPAFGDEPFAGEGSKTLQWLTEEGLPAIRKELPIAEAAFYTLGYSLSGLFALWALYESDAFSGGACCSGSLWYRGWDPYMKGENEDGKTFRKIAGQEERVYLSLGGKEARTKNEIMATIADATRLQEYYLKADPAVRHTILEWNSGGHFADTGERMAKGLAWILMHID